ncbi:DUF4342 domain-containing protein [Desulfosporosinus sp.]|uniref:DUF4342 domain-containing protein n=1 Tax=Desulfosporosinus sp. TaxID=157907 RepID=UPI000E8C654E|nr:DUF4342 domain-containing protein [Desulfosporosinus sp.]MBC2721047.1 DUF4342 domain-containing protein [Desulfosporosinus sp.]MBC2725631.1 DUF4342 domain-containing protein [Desulfosporosinus sp.]HBV86111.1 DUF4342 domain-containing protein [Desulfosporosinus sp.]
MNEPWTELEKIDILRERMGIGYEEARTALNLAQGDVLKALDDLERVRNGLGQDWDFEEQSQGILDSIKSTMSNISHSTISLKRHDNTIISLSAPLGLALAYTVWRRPGLRLLALVGAVGAAMNHFELEVASNQVYPYDRETGEF